MHKVEGILVTFYPQGDKIEIVLDLLDGRRVVESCEVAPGLEEYLASKVGKPIEMHGGKHISERS